MVSGDHSGIGVGVALPGRNLTASSASGQDVGYFLVTVPDPGSPPASPGSPAADADQIGKNIAAVHEFYARQERELSRSQRLAESIAGAIGRPAFLGAIVGFVAIWIAINAWRVGMGVAAFDPSPYFWLQGLVSLSALLMTTVVLIKQNRLARSAEQRAHLDLKVTLLIVQKAAKLIDLLEELRRDAPNIPDRHDAHATALQHAMDPGSVLEALTESAPLVEATEPNESGGLGAANAEPF